LEIVYIEFLTSRRRSAAECVDYGFTRVTEPLRILLARLLLRMARQVGDELRIFVSEAGSRPVPLDAANFIFAGGFRPGIRGGPQPQQPRIMRHAASLSALCQRIWPSQYSRVETIPLVLALPGIPSPKRDAWPHRAAPDVPLSGAAGGLLKASHVPRYQQRASRPAVPVRLNIVSNG
jgi:hypothetical protein